MEYISHSLDDTNALAEKIADKLKGGECIAFTGGMGMGKTAFTKALAHALSYSGNVSSPTFAIVNEYIGGRLNIYHFDMYRVSSFDDLYSTAFFEYCDDTNGITVCEWSENITDALPSGYIHIDIERGDNENCRIFKITPEIL